MSADRSHEPGGHPEIPYNPLETIPADQVTVRHLLHQIILKTKDGSQWDSGRRATDLYYSGTRLCAATAFRIEKGTSRDNPDRIAQIHRRATIGDQGNSVITNYFILDTPDGLCMEKYDQVSLRRTNEDETRQGLDFVASAVREMQNLREAQAEEAELGLNFVSEQEALDLIDLMDNLEPKKTKNL